MNYDELLDELLSPELIKRKQIKLGIIFQVLGGYTDCTLYKQIPCNGFNYVKKIDEPPRRAKHKVDEVVTGICRFLGNDDDDASFIKLQYS